MTDTPPQLLHLSGAPPLAYRTAGQGAPLVVVHGLGSHMGVWQRNWNALSACGRVTAFDLPGFGASPADPELDAVPAPALLPLLADRLVQAAQALRIDQATWVGHSMGGQLALLLALRFPYRVQRLVLAAPAGIEPYTPPQIRMVEQVLPRMPYGGMLPFEALRRLAALGLLPSRHTPRDLHAILNPLEPTGAYGRRLLRCMASMVRNPLLPYLSHVRQPVLLLAGADDPLIPNRSFHRSTPDAVAAHAAAQLPDCEYHLLAHARHFVPYEAAAEFNRLTTGFLQRTAQHAA